MWPTRDGIPTSHSATARLWRPYPSSETWLHRRCRTHSGILNRRGYFMARNAGRFHFDGGAATYVGTIILAVLITVFTLGICYPFALVLKERWRAKHSYIDGQRLTFTGSAVGLFGTWLKWLFLIIITFGIYSFWVGPRIARWKWENTDFDPRGARTPCRTQHCRLRKLRQQRSRHRNSYREAPTRSLRTARRVMVTVA
jgi:hypothetical protein